MQKLELVRGGTDGEKIIAQAMELYLLGLDLEAERQKLNEIASKHGIKSAPTLAQSRKLDAIMSQFAALEKKHIAETERLWGIKRKVGMQ